MQRAIYIGAGLDIMPALLFPKIKELICIDSLPFSAHGTQSYNVTTDSLYYATRDQRTQNSYSRPDFTPRLRAIFRQNDFELAEDTSDYMLFQRNIQNVYYFYSCAFPNHITPYISAKLSGADTLIIAGHDPHHDVLEYVAHPITLIVNNQTLYSSDPTDCDYNTSTIRELRDNPALIYNIYKIHGRYVPYDCQTKAVANQYQVSKIDANILFN